jgi:hypothetical protein
MALAFPFRKILERSSYLRYVEIYTEMTKFNFGGASPHCSYLSKVLWNTTVKVHRGHHVPSGTTAIDITHFDEWSRLSFNNTDQKSHNTMPQPESDK